MGPCAYLPGEVLDHVGLERHIGIDSAHHVAQPATLNIQYSLHKLRNPPICNRPSLSAGLIRQARPNPADLPKPAHHSPHTPHPAAPPLDTVPATQAQQCSLPFTCLLVLTAHAAFARFSTLGLSTTSLNQYRLAYCLV